MNARPFTTPALLALVAPFACGACTKEASSKERASAPDGKVALLLSTLQEERYRKDQLYFEEMAKREGLSTFTLSADNDNARQLSQVEDALSRGASVLVIQPTDSAAAGAYVAKAHARGARVVAYDRSIPHADFYVEHDSYRIGVIQAEEALKATHGRGNYVLLDGQSGHSVTSDITRGYHDTLRPFVESGAVTVVVEKNHDAWSPEDALRTVEDAISKTKGNIQAILANNSGMARGAVQGVQAGGLGDRGVFIAGADADAANINYVCERKQSIDVLKDIRPLAEKAASVAAALVRNQPIDASTDAADAPLVAVPVVLVTPENVKSVLIDSGFHQPSALPHCAQ
jgi:D-xylose transport system substrate-binding protein